MDPTRSEHEDFFEDLALAAIFCFLMANYVFGFLGPIKNTNIVIGSNGFSEINLAAIIAGLGIGYFFRGWQPDFVSRIFDEEKQKYEKSGGKSKTFNFDPFWDQVEKAAGHRHQKQNSQSQERKQYSRSFDPKPGTKPIRSTYLATLGLSAQASDLDIKKAYKNMARQHHPDLITALGGTDEQVRNAEERMKQINAAYEWLSL